MKIASTLPTAAIVLVALAATVTAETISEINGINFLSPYSGETVTNVTGILTAKGSDGIWLRSDAPDNDTRTSESIYIYSSKTAISKLSVGDLVSLNGKVKEYRSSDDYVYLTEITSPTDITVLSTGHTVAPIILGETGLNPPTEQYTSLDDGDVFGVPNNSSLLSVSNPVLQPGSYGMDFWESVSGELVTIKNPVSIGKANQYGDTWVVGDWATTGKNGRGGLTMTAKDANPETIVIINPLDGTGNPTNTKLGDQLDDITGIVSQAYGFYSIYPLTAISVSKSASPALPNATSLVSDGTCKKITIATYNCDNLASNSTTLSQIADHIANYLRSPTIVFLQEIQDNDGPTDDGVVDANKTLTTLANAAQSAGGISYSFIDIDPVNDQDGGEPGGNIRQAYLYDASVVHLHNPNPGTSTQATEVLPGPELKYNPGRIDPENKAWNDSRKPLVAAWEMVADDGASVFFTINVHLASKLGGTSIEGDERPPVNGGIEYRQEQAKVTASFISTLLNTSSSAKIITAGDFNEYVFVKPLETFTSSSGLQDLDEVAGISPVERYTYVYENDCEQLDHFFISQALVTAGARLEHVHVNTWVSYDGQASDHDPSVALVDVCA